MRSSGERTHVYIYISIILYIYIVIARPLSPQEGARSRSPQLGLSTPFYPMTRKNGVAYQALPPPKLHGGSKVITRNNCARAEGRAWGRGYRLCTVRPLWSLLSKQFIHDTRSIWSPQNSCCCSFYHKRISEISYQLHHPGCLH